MIAFLPLLKFPFRDNSIQGFLPVLGLNPFDEDLEDLVDG